MGGRDLPWFLIGATSSSWALRGACTKFEHSDVGKQPNELISIFLSIVTARPWEGPESAKEKRIVLLDVSSPAVVVQADAYAKGRRPADGHEARVDGLLSRLPCPEGKHAQGHSEGCRARLEAEIAMSEVGRIRLTTASLRGLAGDDGRPGGGSVIPEITSPGDVPMGDGTRSSGRS